MTDHTVLITQMLILCVIAALFGLLHIIAAASQFRKGHVRQNLMMLIGGFLMLLAVVLCITGFPLDWVAALLGGCLVCLNAVLNGKRNGEIHWPHHAIRSAFALALVIGFAML